MARILFLHGLAGRPGGKHVAALCARGHDVHAPTLPFSEARIKGLMLSLVERWQRDGRVADPLPRWTEQAQGAYTDFEPHLVVGVGLGAVLAMRIHSAETPQVLVAPPWSGRVNVNAVAEQSWRPLLRCLSAFLPIKPAVKSATVVLHSPTDAVIAVEDSIRLLRDSAALSDAGRACIESLGRELSERGHRPLFGRLLLAGDSHRCDCPDGLTALADAADAALAATVRELAMA